MIFIGELFKRIEGTSKIGAKHDASGPTAPLSIPFSGSTQTFRPSVYRINPPHRSKHSYMRSAATAYRRQQFRVSSISHQPWPTSSPRATGVKFKQRKHYAQSTADEQFNGFLPAKTMSPSSMQRYSHILKTVSPSNGAIPWST